MYSVGSFPFHFLSPSSSTNCSLISLVFNYPCTVQNGLLSQCSLSVKHTQNKHVTERKIQFFKSLILLSVNRTLTMSYCIIFLLLQTLIYNVNNKYVFMYGCRYGYHRAGGCLGPVRYNPGLRFWGAAVHCVTVWQEGWEEASGEMPEQPGHEHMQLMPGTCK